VFGLDKILKGGLGMQVICDYGKMYVMRIKVM